jgi:hypothetical protein
MMPTAGTSVTSSHRLFNQTDNPSTKRIKAIDGIAAEPVGSGSYDGIGALGSPHRGASRPTFSIGKQEEHYGESRNKGPEQPNTG